MKLIANDKVYRMPKEAQTIQLKYDVSSVFWEIEENREKCQSGLPVFMLNNEPESTWCSDHSASRFDAL